MTSTKLEYGLELALQNIDSGAKKARNITIMKRYFGFDGMGGSSMEEAGRDFELTRESVRQITNRISSAFPSALPLVPAIQDAIKIIGEMMPCAASDAEKKLFELGFISKDFKIEGVINAGKCFGLITSEAEIIKLNDVRFIVSPAHQGLPKAIHSKAIKDISHNGAVSVQELAKLASGASDESALLLVNRIIESMDFVKWIDEDKNWFYFNGRGRNRLISRLNKIFSVLNHVPVKSLMSGIERSWSKNLKENTTLLPVEQMVNLVKSLNGFSVDEDIISREGGEHYNEEVRPFEMAIVEYINSKEDKIAKEKEIEDAIVMNVQDKYNYSMALNYSPLFMKRERPEGSPEGRYFRGQYVLIGSMR